MKPAMAVYKVPQDVEADDKLLGPFSFRQFIYLIVALMGVTLAWFLGRLFVPLAILPLPIVVLFGALALPLKKDQPMEVYLAAVLSFYLKPRRRLWQADGIQSLVEIVTPKVVEEQRTKGLSEDEAERRLSYLANLVDSRGWAVRGLDVPQVDSAMQEDVFFEALQTEDILDDTSSVVHAFNDMIDRADAKRRQDAVSLMSQSPHLPNTPSPSNPYTTLDSSLPQVQPALEGQEATPTVTYNPYPSAMRQSVIHPTSPPPPKKVQQPHQDTAQPNAPASQIPTSADIMNLATNTDLSIETIAHEAKRIREKKSKPSSEEVIISLR